MGQVELGLPGLRKVLEAEMRRAAGASAAAKSTGLQSQVAGRPILRLWLTTSYFTSSVSWVTDLAPYLPQYGPGHYEEKMTQVSGQWLIPSNAIEYVV